MKIYGKNTAVNVILTWESRGFNVMQFFKLRKITR